ncbi:MAG: DNA polymerase III subunit chi [Candidatus Methylumidiphilus sp.]
MTRIDFYVLSTSTPHERRVLACKLAEKAWRQGMKIHILTASETETGIMDNLLWTFRQGSFIPHAKTNASPEELADVPILVGAGVLPDGFHDLLINLSLETPPDLALYQRVAELVDEDETVRTAGRRRYAAYKQQGHVLETHKL